MDTISPRASDFVFPQNPYLGQAVQGPTGAVWWWDGTKWIGGTGSTIQIFLPISGGTMTGPLYLSEDPTEPDQAVTKNYVDDIALKAIPEAPFTGQAFGRMLGTWTPVLPIVGGAMRGNIIMTSPFTVTNLPQPINPTDAVPLNYIEGLLTTGLQYMGTWQVAANLPDLALNVASFNNGDYWLAITADPTVPEEAPPQIPGIGGETISNGSMVVWNEPNQIFSVVPSTGLTMVQGDARYLQLAGGTMTGLITLSGDATSALNPVSYQQMQALVALYLSLAGGVMTGGGITMAPAYAPFNPQDVATKSYVDTSFENYTPVFVGVSPPVSPADGNLWWDAVSGNLFIWYVDATGAQWVVANDTDPGPQGPPGLQGPQGPEGPPGPVYNFQGTVDTAADLPPTGNGQGDAYIAEDTGILWIWNGTQWVDAGVITGPPGPQGPQGPVGPPFDPPTTGTGGIFVQSVQPAIVAPTVTQGAAITGGATVDTLTVGSPGTTSPAPLVVGGQGITYSSVGAGGQNIALITSAGSLYCFQNGVAFGGAIITSSGGTMTGALNLSGNATANLQAVPLQQLNSMLAGYVTAVGHAFAMSWDGTFVNISVDNTGTPGQLANVTWANNTFATPNWVGAYFLQLSGGTISGEFVVAGALIANGNGGSMYGNWNTNSGTITINFTGGTGMLIQSPQNTDSKIQLNEGVPNGGGWGWQLSAQGYSSPGQFWIYNVNNGFAGIIVDDGANCYNQFGTWGSLSDARVKTVTGSYTVGLDAINALEPIVFNYNGKAGTFNAGSQIGLDAESVKAVIPEAVKSLALRLNPDDTSDTDILTVNTGPLIHALINAVKELTSRVVALEGSR